MKTDYTIKNFRVFGNDGATFSIAPITIMTGCNSAGKSSLVKSLLLISDYLSSFTEDKEYGKDIIIGQHFLDFTKQPNNLLGKFDKVVNSKSKDKRVTFEFKTYSLMLSGNVIIKLTFEGTDKDEHTNGYISDFSISKSDGTVIFADSKDKGRSGNLYSVFQEFLRFVYTENYINSYRSITLNRIVGDGEYMPDEEYKVFTDNLKKYISNVKETHGRQVVLDANLWGRKNASFLLKYSHNKAEMIEKVKDTGILYYLPVFDNLLGLSKEEAIMFLENYISDNDLSQGIAFMFNKVISDMKISNAKSFEEYYKTWEITYLSDISGKNIFPKKHESPSLFRSSDYVLKGENSIMSPYNVEYVSFLDDAEFKNITLTDKNKRIEEWEKKPLDFSEVFETFAIISEKLYPDNKLHYDVPEEYCSIGFYSRTESLFMKYIEVAIEEIITTAMPEMITYVSSSIINVKRIYPLEANDEFTTLIKRYIAAKRKLTADTEYIPNTFINKWMKAFEIGESIDINVDPEGLGATLRLHKTENDKAGTLLADNGYGITQLFAILLNIEVAILERKITKEIPANNFEPIVRDEDIVIKYSSPCVAIEEPEIHLHPRFQSLLADMFIEAYSNYNVHFIIETHSEYLIRKIQKNVALHSLNPDNGISADDISIYYLYSPDKHKRPIGEPQIKKIGIREDGRLTNPFGSGFFDESSSLSMDLLTIKAQKNG